jgi:hypothetical protein
VTEITFDGGLIVTVTERGETKQLTTVEKEEIVVA